MTIQMNIAEAKAKLSELVARAEAGEEILIARDGRVVAEIRARPATKEIAERRPGYLAHLGPLTNPYAILEPMSEDELDELERGHPGDPLSHRP